ncbi:hypothetical protein [Buttiauxella sp.]|uniref:hypothetical protein n=1 Tax=Buttiauxella sp. TaxID=1972222 RepID=UPI003C7236CD
MPLETPQYIDTLVPEWPTGADPLNAGDDHIRVIKQVLKNTFPALAAPMLADANNINGITGHFNYVAGDGIGANLPRMEAHNDEWTAAICITAQTPSPAQYAENAAFVLTGSALQNMIYPVGHVLTTKRAGNPVEWLGFGTWVPLLGWIVGGGGIITDIDGYTEEYGIGTVAGHFRVHSEHVSTFAASWDLNTDSQGDHNHSFTGAPVGYWADADGDGSNNYLVETGTGYTSTGGAHVHDVQGSINVGLNSLNFKPPSQAIHVWERTA